MKIKNLFKKLFFHNFPKNLITLYPETKNIKGRVLFSYLILPHLAKDDDPIFDGHSNMWESREIARIFTRLGYIVDAIDFRNYSFLPTQNYDIIFDIDLNLQRLMPYLKFDCIKILHMTGSYSRFQNQAEMQRVQNFEKRKNVFYTPKRLDSFLELVDRSLQFANKISLLGNDFVFNTFPKDIQNKIYKVPVSASKLSFIKKQEDFVPQEREFLWFFGGGAVHKGLDLVLEVFIKNRNLKLNIVGNVKGEKDFWQVYENELTNFSNIYYCGHLNPSSIEFKNLIKKCFCFIAPSCSEATSAAVATCLRLGLFPIVSRNTGVDLPKNCGIYLNDCSIEEIEQAVFKVYKMDNKNLENQIFACQQYALKTFSRENFSEEMTKFVKQIIKD